MTTIASQPPVSSNCTIADSNIDGSGNGKIGKDDNDMVKSPSVVEKQFVHDVYQEIAHCFSSPDGSNRHWPNVVAFLDSLEPGAVVADVGCGDGKYMATAAARSGRLSMLSIDACTNLLRPAYAYASKTPACDVVASNNLSLALRSGCFDAVISVGVLHHFATVERRVQALRELARLLRPDGRLLVYVWALEQQRRNFSSQDVLVPSMSNSCCSEQPRWPVKNGQEVVFEEFPNWPNDEPTAVQWRCGGNDDDDDDDDDGGEEDGSKKKKRDNSDHKMGNPGTSSSSQAKKGNNDDDAAAKENSKENEMKERTSFFDRLLPPFIRARRKSNEATPKDAETTDNDKKRTSCANLADDDDDAADAAGDGDRKKQVAGYGLPPIGTSSSNVTPKTDQRPVVTTLRKRSSSSSSSSSPPCVCDAVKKDDVKSALYRYYHVFCRGELEKLVQALNDEGGEREGRAFVSRDHSGDNGTVKLEVVRSFYDHANWAVELRRLH